MKFKITALLKFTALFLCLIMALPMILSCGEKAEEADSGTSSADANADTPTPAPTDPPTDPPPTDPPPTEPPTEPIDPNLPYYEYLDEEFKRFGFSGGDWIIADTEEAAVNSAFRAKECSRTALDVSGDGVPFSYAHRYEINALAANFWDKAAEANFSKDKTLTEGDIIAGVIYVRDGGGENPAKIYFAIKTPTNEWNGEGNQNIMELELDPADGWQKIYFCGESMCDENPASTALFEMFLGYEPHTIDIGGIYMMRYPYTSENMKATTKMP